MGSDDIKKRKITKNREVRKTRKMSRKSEDRTLIPKILILTEGLSEDIYFRSLKIILKLPSLNVKKSSFTDSIGIINQAMEIGTKSIQERDEYNYIFCIFDLDTVKNKEFLSKINHYNSKFKDENSSIHPVFSFPCIELWFILHYHCHNAPFTRTQTNSIGDNVKLEFKKYRSDYSESNEKCIFEISSEYKRAIYNSETLIKRQKEYDSINPITNIHQLVILLQSINERTQSYTYKPKTDKFILEKIN